MSALTDNQEPTGVHDLLSAWNDVWNLPGSMKFFMATVNGHWLRSDTW
jgi:hypothetical protein